MQVVEGSGAAWVGALRQHFALPVRKLLPETKFYSFLQMLTTSWKNLVEIFLTWFKIGKGVLLGGQWRRDIRMRTNSFRNFAPHFSSCQGRLARLCQIASTVSSPQNC